MKTNKPITWTKGSYSAIPNNSQVIPAGSPVDLWNGHYWIRPAIFPEGSIDRHDAAHYGIRVKVEDIDFA